jgi:hypothetical protein
VRGIILSREFLARSPKVLALQGLAFLTVANLSIAFYSRNVPLERTPNRHRVILVSAEDCCFSSF